MEIDALYTAESHSKGAEVNIVNPVSREKTDVFIKVLGPDSKEFRQKQKEIYSEAAKPDFDKNRDISLELLTAVTVGWRGLTKDGKDLDFNKKACRELYAKSPSIMDQVDRFISDYRNFTKG